MYWTVSTLNPIVGTVVTTIALINPWEARAALWAAWRDLQERRAKGRENDARTRAKRSAELVEKAGAGDDEAVARLLELGADTATRVEGRTAADAAAEGGNLKCLQVRPSPHAAAQLPSL